MTTTTILTGTLKGLNDTGQPTISAKVDGATKGELVVNTMNVYYQWISQRMTTDNVPPVSAWFLELSDGTTTTMTDTFRDMVLHGLGVVNDVKVAVS